MTQATASHMTLERVKIFSTHLVLSTEGISGCEGHSIGITSDTSVQAVAVKKQIVNGALTV